MSIANAEDPGREKEEVRAVVHNLIDGLLRERRPTRGAHAPAINPPTSA